MIVTEEPSLFGELDAERAAAEDMAESIFDEPASVHVTANDLPPPAYQPDVAAFEPNRDDVVQEPVREMPRAPGTPSPEAMARLRAAAQKQAPMPQARPEDDRRTAQGEKQRFGINSLINRMTGHGEASAAAPARQQPPVQQRAQSPAPVPQDAPDADQERIEIPAFLRRQAN